jgi:hypothetical protein
VSGIARTLVVTIAGTEHKVRTNPGDYAAFTEERGERRKATDFTFEDLLWLAHRVCTRLELTDLTLDDFLARGLEDLEVPGAGRR